MNRVHIVLVHSSMFARLCLNKNQRPHKYYVLTSKDAGQNFPLQKKTVGIQIIIPSIINHRHILTILNIEYAFIKAYNSTPRLFTHTHTHIYVYMMLYELASFYFRKDTRAQRWPQKMPMYILCRFLLMFQELSAYSVIFVSLLRGT